MSSPDFSEARALFSLPGLLAVSVLLASCASSGPSADPSAALTTMAPEDVTPEARTQYEQAAAALAADDLTEAELRFEEFLLRYPNIPGAHVNLAIVHAKNGNEADAENSITDALLLDPGHAAALNQLGMLLRRQGKFEDAESAYLRALKERPDYALVHYNLAVLYELYLRRFDDALEHYERYQALGTDASVEKWIVDLKRRIEAGQRAANVTE